MTRLTVEPRQLRGYQDQAVQAILQYWSSDTETGRYTPVVVLPTGTGKSTVIAAVACIARGRGQRVALVTHRRELLDQMAESVMAVAPEGERVGIVQGDRNDPSTAIVAASFQTLQNQARLSSLGHRDVVLVDEAHHAAADTYLGVLDRLGVLDGQAFGCGFTATASRADGGLGKVWDAVVYERSLKWAIQEGHLITPRGLTVVLDDLDLSKVHVRGGDYASGELAEAMESSVDTTVDAVLRHAPGRACIVFAAGVEHAEALAGGLTSRGVRAAAVTGAMSTDDRESVYTLFRSGELDAMVTVQVLTEGADFPRCDCVVMARPTRSQTLYTQMVGRAVRLYPGKQDALVLDLAGTMRDLSLVTLTDLTPEAETSRVSPTSDEDPGQDEPKPPRQQRIGPAALEDFDLLNVSPANWLKTPGGVLFLDLGGSCWSFLWPPIAPGADQDTTYHVGVLHRPRRYQDGWVQEDPTPLVQAQQLAEDTAPRHGALPSREAAWRKKSKPSDAQVRLATSLGVQDVPLKSRARLSDDISSIKAAKALDVHLN